MKRLAILGSTGSIGSSTLAVAAEHPGEFQVTGLAAGQNVQLLADQVKQFHPAVVSVQDEAGAAGLRALLPGAGAPEILTGPGGVLQVATASGADMVVSALVGAVGLSPTLAAIEAGIPVALANKETLVAAGPLVMAAARARGVPLIPVDSEHSAIFQALQGQRPEDIRRLWLTASGGPFRSWEAERLQEVTAAQALKHPNWSMGPKITIDSATMMNKALEVIEASVLFDLPADQIGVYIHPQSIVHSLVEFVDGSVLAQLGVPDMRLPIAYALAYPRRLPLSSPPLDLCRIGPAHLRASGSDPVPGTGPGIRRGALRRHHACGAQRRQRNGRGRLSSGPHQVSGHPPGGGGSHERPPAPAAYQPGAGPGRQPLGPGFCPAVD